MTGEPVTGELAADAATPLPVSGSGPRVARLFHRLLAAIFVIAWLSLGWQVDVLIGSRGLLPIAPFLAANPALGAARFPTTFWLDASDTALHAGVWIGLGLSVAALLGPWPRPFLALATALYLSFAVAGRSFLSFQWDNLLLECGALAAFLPVDRRARWIHVLFRVLLFKLYWESGIAKWQSHLGDWQDGSAMRWYYETAPLPVWPAWYAHHLSAWWHQLESWAVLGLELLAPFGIFGPRAVRLPLFAAFTAFQVVNLATANYGFFIYLALALQVFLLDDRDLARVMRRAATSRPAGASRGTWRRQVGRAAAAVVIATYVCISILDAAAAFTDPPPAIRALLGSARSVYGPWRLVNTYHLFGHITRERIEPELQAQVDGDWQPLHFHHKPGPVTRAPDLVAPHQPRVDFQLWFYGLSFRGGMPAYVGALLERVCGDPAAVQSLFADPLPEHPSAVRIVFWDYRFSEPATRRDTGAWWKRTEVAATNPLQCPGR